MSNCKSFPINDNTADLSFDIFCQLLDVLFENNHNSLNNYDLFMFHKIILVSLQIKFLMNLIVSFV